MKSLGLFGGVATLPNLAINTIGANIVPPYPEGMDVTYAGLRSFIQNYLTGRYIGSNYSSQEKAVKAVKQQPEDIVGVSESFDPKGYSHTSHYTYLFLVWIYVFVVRSNCVYASLTHFSTLFRL